MSNVGEAYHPVYTIGQQEPPLLSVLPLDFVLAVGAKQFGATLDSGAAQREVDDTDPHWGIDNTMLVSSDWSHESGALHGSGATDLDKFDDVYD